MSAVTMVINEHCFCGENPLWDEQRRLFYWSDITTGRLFRLDWSTGQHQQIYQGDKVGGFTFEPDGSLLLFRETDIAKLDDDGKLNSVIPFADEGVPRFNDVMATPNGTVLAGTMGQDKRGGLYRVDLDGSITNLWRGSDCSNGMAFTSNLKKLFWTDSTAKRIDIIDHDPDTGELSNRQPWLTLDPDDAIPDGITIDVQDHLYVAFFGGACIRKYSPDGSEIDRIDMPVQRITSCCFAGDDLKTLMITTAGGDPNSPQDTLDGALFKLELDVAGRAEFRSRINPA